MLTPLVKQSWVVFGVLANMCSLGMSLAYTAFLLPALAAPDSPIKTDLNSRSWIASSLTVSAIFGFTSSSYMMDKLGRKVTHCVMLIPVILGWVVIYYATSVAMLLWGRILCGISTGATVTLGAVVIAEYTSPQNRGLFLNLKTAATNFGVLIAHVIGHYFHWTTAALFVMIPAIFTFFNVLTWPESPSWLVAQNKLEKSKKSFFWLRGYDEESMKEFDSLLRGQKERMAQARGTSTFQDEVLSFIRKFKQKDFMMPVAIITLTFTLLEVCGRHFFPVYALDIVQEVSGDNTNSFAYTVILDSLVTASVTFASVLTKVFKRRSILFFSGISSVITLLALSTYLYLSTTGMISKDRSWIPISILVMYFVLTNLGCTSLPLVLLGEIFPLPHRGAGSAVTGVIMSVTMMTVLQATPRLIAKINMYGTFMVYAAVMVITLAITYFILPETKNRTLQEIEDYFNHGRYLDDEEIEEDEEAKTKMFHEETTKEALALSQSYDRRTS